MQEIRCFQNKINIYFMITGAFYTRKTKKNQCYRKDNYVLRVALRFTNK